MRDDERRVHNRCQAMQKAMGNRAYRVRSIICTLEMHHAVNASKRGASTLAAMGIELLLGQNITTGLLTSQQSTGHKHDSAWFSVKVPARSAV